MTEHIRTKEERFEKFAAILIALTTIFAAGTTALERLASHEADKADRAAEELSLNATTERIDGAVRFSYDWQGAFQTWRELDLLISNAEQFGDTAAVERYRSLQADLEALSPLLQYPYFDPTRSGFPDSSAYEADLYVVNATRFTEQYQNEAEFSNYWEQISNQFVLQLTLYAVALSLFGLSTTIRSFIRWLFVALGSLLVFVNLIWGAALFFVQYPALPDQAIDEYAAGVGLAWEGRDNEAIGAFNNAISLAPQYANAYYERANSHYAVGNYAQAAADYEAAIAAGRDDTNALWNLGWTYYLLGQFDNAVRINQHALAVDPTLIAVRMNQGAALLAQGRIENAITEYDLALNEAVRQVAEARARGEQPPASLWYYMDAGAADLQSLLDEAGGAPRAWTQSPPASAIIIDRTALETNARQLIVRIKETAVALEFSGAAPGPRGGAAASEFQFVQEVYDVDGNFVEYRDSAVNEYGINQIGILFDYSGFTTGAREVWKVYVNGYEDPALRVVGELALTGGGSGIKRISYAFSKIFVFAPGEYTVELYIDHHLIRSGTFIVENP